MVVGIEADDVREKMTQLQAVSMHLLDGGYELDP